MFRLNFILAVVSFLNTSYLSAKERPLILVKSEEGEAIFQKIEEQKWAETIYTDFINKLNTVVDFATGLTYPKNIKSDHKGVSVRAFEEGGRLVAAATLKEKSDLIIGGGSGQMLIQVKEVNNRIKPYDENPGYWQYKGKPVYLLGGNRVVNPFQMEQGGLMNYLDELQLSGGNYFRNVMSDREPGSNKAFKRLDNGKYDLTQWNDEYWDGLKNMLKWSFERDIIVNLTFWDRFDHYDQIGHRDTSREVLWINSPWNPVNNVNYTTEESGLDSTYAGHPITGINPFHQTPPMMKVLQVVLHFQKLFVGRILDLSMKYGNVIFNMGNEHQLDLKDWDMYWAEFSRNYASEKGYEIETTAMFDHVIHKEGEWVRVQGFSPVIEENDLYTFVEGSKVGSQWTAPGEAQYKAAIELINNAAEVKKRPVNAVKVRTQNIVYNAQERLWRPLMAGFAALSHHRAYLEGLTDDGWPIGGLALTELAKTNIQAMRIFTDLIIPWESVPRQDLLSDREEDEAYLKTKEGVMYGICFPKGSGSVGLDMKNFNKPFKVQWIDIGKGEVVLESEINGGNIISIETPYEVEYGWACAITALN